MVERLALRFYFLKLCLSKVTYNTSALSKKLAQLPKEMRQLQLNYSLFLFKLAL